MKRPTPDQTAAQLGGQYDPTPSTDDRYLGYVGVSVYTDAGFAVQWMPPVVLGGPAAAWDYVRAHGGHAEEVRITDAADALVLHVGRGPDGLRRVLWPTVEGGAAAEDVDRFDEAIRTGTVPPPPRPGPPSPEITL